MKKEPHNTCSSNDELDGITHYVISELAKNNDIDNAPEDDPTIDIVNDVSRDLFSQSDADVGTTPSHGLVDCILASINRRFVLDKHEQRGGTKKK